MLFQLAFLQLRLLERLQPDLLLVFVLLSETQPKPIYLCSEIKKREQLASREHNKVLRKLMLSGSGLERPGRPNLPSV